MLGMDGAALVGPFWRTSVKLEVREETGMALSAEERPIMGKVRGFAAGDSPTVPMSLGAVRMGTRFTPITAFFIPALVVGLASVVAARLIVATPWWTAFATVYPAVVPDATVPTGYTAWVRWLHYLSFVIMSILVRSGVQILADHPRLYWTLHSTPGREWIRFRGPVPRDRLWTAKDDSAYLPGTIGLPGGRHVIGLARLWHFFSVLSWLCVGVLFYIALFATDQWRRLIPHTWTVFPGALTTLVTYLSLHIPPGDGGVYDNALQQLAYFATVFLAAPLSILTGLAMSPALINAHPRYQRLFGNRQVARSLHFLLWCYYLGFFVVHVGMVGITNLRGTTNRMFAGFESNAAWNGVIIAAAGIVAMVAVNALANWISWHRPRALQHAYQRTVMRVMGAVFDRFNPDVQYRRDEISPYHWPNGKLPTSEEYQTLSDGGFKSYRLRVFGEVDTPVELSLSEIKAFGKHEQITLLHCIQGWSGIAQWGGLQLSRLMEIVKPRSGARYAVFYSFGEGGEGGQYYDVHEVRELRHSNAILAYEMNFEPLSIVHGAPLRLRNERQLGFKMVKWIKEIEFVADYRSRGLGEGGYNEDHEYFGSKAEI
jgi:methionine sulfoxide reductase catalytic subunit